MNHQLYRSEALTWYEYNKFRVRAVGIDFLRSAYGIIMMDWERNEVVRNLCNVKRSLDEKVECV